MAAIVVGAKDSSTPLKIQSKISPSDQRTFHRPVLLVIGLLLGVSVPKEKKGVSKFPHDFFLPSAVFLLFAGFFCVQTSGTKPGKQNN